MEELFVPIEGYPNYVVSSYGRVINTKFDRDLVPTLDVRTDTQKVTLYNNGIPRTFYLHRLVAKGFFLNYQEDLEVGFLNGKKNDCSITNITIDHRKKARWEG